MAIFYLKVKPFCRKGGHSIVNYVANLFGETLFDVQRDKFFSCSAKDKSRVLSTALHLPKKIRREYWLDKKIFPDTFLDRQTLWNLAEQSESRSNSRTAREIIVNIPCELPLTQQKRLMNFFAQYLSNTYDVPVDGVLRSPADKNDVRSFRAHFLLSTRIVEINEHNEIVLGRKSILEWSNSQLKEANLPSCQAELTSIRKAWEMLTNDFLQTQGVNQRIDSRSYAEQGLKLSPTTPLGPTEFSLEKKGIQTKRGNYNRQINTNNQKIIETQNLYERKVQQRIEHTNTFIEAAGATTEATNRAIIKREKFAARSHQTNQFIEKYHQQAAETDRRIADLYRTKS